MTIEVIIVHVMKVTVHDNIVVVSVLHNVMRMLSTQNTHKLLSIMAVAARITTIRWRSTYDAQISNAYWTIVGAGSDCTSFISTSALIVHKLLMWNWLSKVEHSANETPTTKK